MRLIGWSVVVGQGIVHEAPTFALVLAALCAVQVLCPYMAHFGVGYVLARVNVDSWMDEKTRSARGMASCGRVRGYSSAYSMCVSWIVGKTRFGQIWRPSWRTETVFRSGDLLVVSGESRIVLAVHRRHFARGAALAQCRHLRFEDVFSLDCRICLSAGLEVDAEETK